MKKESWQKVDDIVFKALQIESEKRQDFIEKECGESTELLFEVESLLANENAVDDYFESPAIFKYADFFEEDQNKPSEFINQKIGNYRLQREIGFGGMGAVYLAERVDGKFDQKVAIKLLKRELNTKSLRRRFTHEREILGSLEHPNIARLLDAGSTEDQIPFLVMEYIEGDPIDIYCNKNNLNLDERLTLFRTVCVAVNFAHRNLVVHRDIKPSNIIVTDEGIPKLLDFGIAKLLSGNAGETTKHTVTKLGAMTPSYASPEQLRRESVTTSTDVYSLGIVLYELLSGHRPFENVEDDLGEIFKAVCETDPPLPSTIVRLPLKSIASEIDSEMETMVHDDPDSLGSKSKNPKTENIDVRSTHPQVKSFSPQSLRGDLDNIILKSLKKEPERRYSSAENFAEDIRRHQDGLTITARPDTFSYRTGKFIKRNRFAAASASLILLAIMGGLGTTLWQARVAQAEKTKAEKRFNDVRALADSFLFEITPEIEKLNGSTKAKELVVKRALEYLDKLSTDSTDDKELQEDLAAAYQKVGDVQGNPYQKNIGDLGGALNSYEKSQNISEKLFKQHPNDLKLKKSLSKTYGLIGDVYFYKDDLKKAEAVFQKAIKLNEQIITEYPNDDETQKAQGSLLNSLGLIPFWAGDNKKALKIYDRSLKIFEMLHKKHPKKNEHKAQVANTHVRIGEALGWDDQPQKAIVSIQKGLDLIKEVNKDEPKNKNYRRTLMLSYMRLGETYADVKTFDKSLDLYQKSVDIAKQAMDEDKANKRGKRDYITIKFKLAETLDMAGKNAESLKHLIEVLGMQKELAANDPTNPTLKHDVATTHNSIGEAEFNLKQFNSALKSFTAALNGFEYVKNNGGDEGRAVRDSAIARINVGKTYIKLAINQSTLREKGLSFYKNGLRILEKLDSDGKLTALDKKLIPETKDAIKKIQK